MYIKHDAEGALPKGTHHPGPLSPLPYLPCSYNHGWCYTACLTSTETLFSHTLIEALPICFQRQRGPRRPTARLLLHVADELMEMYIQTGRLSRPSVKKRKPPTAVTAEALVECGAHTPTRRPRAPDVLRRPTRYRQQAYNQTGRLSTKMHTKRHVGLM